jgi:putative ABC transport system permease protein
VSSDFLRLAAQSIAHRKLRSWLTVIGVFIGITAVVALISIGLGLDKTIKDQVSQVFGVDTFMILSEDAFGPPSGGGDIDEFVLDLSFLRSLDGVRVAAAIREQTGFVQGPPGADGTQKQGFLQVMGLSPELATEFPSFTGDLEVKPGGRLFDEGERDVAVLGHEAAERLGAGVGDPLLIGGANDAEITVTVVGVLTDQDVAEPSGGFGGGMGPSPDEVYLPFDTMTELWGTAEDVFFALVRTEPGADVDDVADRVEEALNQRGSEITAVTYSDISEQIGQVTTIVSAFLAGIAGISLLVGGVGVMNTMFTSVLERTKEIGVMKAVGAKNSHVLMIFLIESGLMGLVGGVVGTVLGLGLSAVASGFISRFFGVELVVVASPSLIVVTLLGSFAIGAFAGLWPARRAARMSVVDALRYE